MSVRDRRRGVEIDLALEPSATASRSRSPHGRSYIWTRKWLARATGEVRCRRSHLRGGRAAADRRLRRLPRTRRPNGSGLPASGATDRGREVAWNLVTGVHDAARDSERTVWVDGVGDARSGLSASPAIWPASPPPTGSDLSFTAEATRERDTTTSDSCAATTSSRSARFAGSLPDGLQTAHRARRDGTPLSTLVTGSRAHERNYRDTLRLMRRHEEELDASAAARADPAAWSPSRLAQSIAEPAKRCRASPTPTTPTCGSRRASRPRRRRSGSYCLPLKGNPTVQTCKNGAVLPAPEASPRSPPTRPEASRCSCARLRATSPGARPASSGGKERVSAQR